MNLRHWRLAIIAIGIAFLGLGVSAISRPQEQTAQSPEPPLPSFEVASVKLDSSGARGRFFQFPSPDRFRTVNMPTRDMIEFAYKVKPFQVTGGPSWIDSDGYAIDAKVESAMAAQMEKMTHPQQADQIRLMLRSLLADRFKLTLSRGTKEAPMYALVVAKGGAKLTPTTYVPPDPNGAKSSPKSGEHLFITPGGISAMNQPMSGLAEILAFVPDLSGRVVQDQTGIKGNYDFELKFNPGFARGPEAPPSDDAASTSVFTALQEQLGLRLESTKGPMDIYTIEHVERPSEN